MFDVEYTLINERKRRERIYVNIIIIVIYYYYVVVVAGGFI